MTIEWQDLTPAHLLLVRLLAGPAGEVYAVGDDDQTIYGYTGASPRWLVDFERWFPGAADHRLTVNYRCPPAVVAAASSLLTSRTRRLSAEQPSRWSASSMPARKCTMFSGGMSS